MIYRMSAKSDQINNFYKRLFSKVHLNKGITTFIFSVAIVFLLAISFSTFRQINTFIDSNKWVTHTYQVIQTANTSLYEIMELESQQRGFLINGNPDYLSDLGPIREDLDANLNSLKILTIDNFDQNHRIITFINLVNKRLDLLNQIVQLKSSNAIDEHKLSELLFKSKNLSNRVTDIGGEIIAVEFVLLKERKAALLNNASSTNIIFILGSLFSTIFLIIAFSLVIIELSSRNRIQENNKRIQLQLRKIIENSSDMIAAYDANYKLIIFNEAYQREFKNLFGKTLEKDCNINDVLTQIADEQKIFAQRWFESLQKFDQIQLLEFNDAVNQLSYESNSSTILDDNNNLSGIVHSVRNITNRIQDHKKLQESHRELELNMVELQKKNTQISYLVEMSDVMLACSSQEELCLVMSRFSQRLMPYAQGYLFVMHPSRNYLEISTHWGKPFKQNTTFAPDQCWAIRLGRVHHVSITREELLCEHIDPSLHDTASLCVPLMAKNDIYGMLYIESDNDKLLLSDENRLVINAFAELTALALANIRLRDNLNYQSIRDPLTGLYNRRYLEDFLLKELFQAERDNSSFAVLMLDLDHFKKINDTNGHDAGDMALKEFSKILVSDIRSGDIASRYGGEEFIAILHNIDKEAARARAESIREAVSLISIKYGAHQVNVLTVSIGIAMYPSDETSVEKLIEAADKALYNAKNTGRNKVIHYSEL